MSEQDLTDDQLDLLESTWLRRVDTNPTALYGGTCFSVYDGERLQALLGMARRTREAEAMIAALEAKGSATCLAWNQLVEELEAKVAQLEAACAQMREALECEGDYENMLWPDFCKKWNAKLFTEPAKTNADSVVSRLRANALSSKAGKGRHSPEEWQALEAACAEKHDALQECFDELPPLPDRIISYSDKCLESAYTKGKHALSSDVGKVLLERLGQYERVIKQLCGTTQDIARGALRVKK